MFSLLNSREEAFRPFREHFDKVFDSFFGSESENAIRSLSRSGYPKVDVFHTKDGQFRVEAAMPGVKLDQIKVEVLPESAKSFGIDSTRRVLKISGKMDNVYQCPQDTSFQVRELRRSYFERAFLLPDNLEGDPEAVLENGMLRLTWPVKIEQSQPQAKLISVTEIKS